MKMLVIGSNGQLGRELRRSLEIGRSEMGAIPKLYESAQADFIDIGDIDITDYSSVLCWFENHGPYDLAINCAAITNVDGCENNEASALKTNAIGPRNIALICTDSGTDFVHISTDYVFSGNDSKPRIESDSIGPLSAYGRSKLAGELLALDACPHTYIVRTSWLYGYKGKNFVKTMLELARSNGHVAVVDDQMGNPTSANDLAYCILSLATTGSYGIYHATGEGTCSWFDFASAAIEAAGISCKKERLTTLEYGQRFPSSAQRPMFSSLDCSHLETICGCRPRAWREALANYIDNLSELGE